MLFGSFARGAAKAQSDVDILIDGAVDTLALGAVLSFERATSRMRCLSS